VFGLEKNRFAGYDLRFPAISNLPNILTGNFSPICVTIKPNTYVYSGWDDKNSQVIALLDEGVELFSNTSLQSDAGNIAIKFLNHQTAWIKPTDLLCN
jgi:hypothetical protein